MHTNFPGYFASVGAVLFTLLSSQDATPLAAFPVMIVCLTEDLSLPSRTDNDNDCPFFTGWLVGRYNGHPDFAHMSEEFATALASSDTVAVVGVGNVALDCARILAKGEKGCCSHRYVCSSRRLCVPLAAACSHAREQSCA